MTLKTKDKPLDTGKTIYKCRNCGELFYDSTTSRYEAVYANFISLLIKGKSFAPGFGSPSELYEIHRCDNDTMGWGDIAGIRKIKGKTVEEQIKELIAKQKS